MKKAIFPGTFDPFTLGHHDILNRSITIFDEIIIGVGLNENKKTMFNVNERIRHIRSVIKKISFKYCIGRIFSFTDKKQKVPFLVPSLKQKLKTKKKIVVENLYHFRDFISIEDLCRAIIFLSKKKYNGTINLASGKKVFIKDIALKIRKNKKVEFKKNEIVTYLIADISKLKKLGFRHKHTPFENIF